MNTSSQLLEVSCGVHNQYIEINKSKKKKKIYIYCDGKLN